MQIELRLETRIFKIQKMLRRKKKAKVEAISILYLIAFIYSA